ncbi:MAG: hypothetical protein ACOCY0_02505 [Roseicyclus sp.]
MSRKLRAAPLLALALLAAQPAEAEPLPEIVRFFNDCAGRIAGHLSVHGWNAGSAISRNHLERIDEILLSVTTPEQADDLAARQSAARAAHVALLAHAMEHGDLGALGEARANLARCREAVLLPASLH